MKAFTRMRKTHYVISLMVVVSVLFAFGSVWAASGGGGHGGEGGLDKGKDLIYRVLNFGVLAVALIFLLRKPIAKGLASRRQGIKDQLDDLEKQKQDAEKHLAEYKEKFGRLDQEMERIIAEYIQQGEAAKAKILEEAKAAAEKLQEQARKNIEHEFQQAKLQLKAEMAEQAVAMAEGIIKKHIKDEDQERIIDEYLTKVVVVQ
ncbi:MAG: ATP synthase F0 subunit B [Desulfobacterales bacterium]|nr:MAG: ATP synthase F0 subunit B [Desulfobacterales bacterium]